MLSPLMVRIDGTTGAENEPVLDWILLPGHFAETGCSPANDMASAVPEKTQVSSPKTGSAVKRKQHKRNSVMSR